MNTKTVSKKTITDLLNDWYTYMRLQNLDKARLTKEEVDAKIDNMEEEDQTLLIYYWLLSFRYKLLTQSFNQSDSPLAQIEPFKENMNNFLNYYFYFFKGMYATTEGHYEEALNYYQKAENKLEDIPDETEKAEFHYRVASAYYHIRQTLLAMNHARQAKAIFSQHPGYQSKTADCDNVLGLCYTSMKRFDKAEEHFYFALDFAEVNHDETLSSHVRYNLGLLYAEQKLPEVAIRHFKVVYESHFNLLKTRFLLAREYFKLGQATEASRLINEGLQIDEKDAKEYHHHLLILKAFHMNIDDTTLEKTINENIAYFENQHLWGYTSDYYEQLANYFFDKQQHVKASHYFRNAYLAKENLEYLA